MRYFLPHHNCNLTSAEAGFLYHVSDIVQKPPDLSATVYSVHLSMYDKCMSCPVSAKYVLITVLNYYYGKSGGSSGSLKQYYVGITGSANPGKDGGSFLPTDTLWIPCCSSSPLVYRNGSPWSDKYASGSGGNSYEHSDSAYLSGGGGGGASVMSQAATESSSMFGYGAGGKGGSATTGSTSKGDAGRDGCLFIAS